VENKSSVTAVSVKFITNCEAGDRVFACHLVANLLNILWKMGSSLWFNQGKA
jgi:hypothetical protein